MVGSAVDKGFKKYSTSIDCKDNIFPQGSNATNITMTLQSSGISDCAKINDDVEKTTSDTKIIYYNKNDRAKLTETLLSTTNLHKANH
jgi:hypothetical protein